MNQRLQSAKFVLHMQPEVGRPSYEKAIGFGGVVLGRDMGFGGNDGCSGLVPQSAAASSATR